MRTAKREKLVFDCQKQRIPAGFVNDVREVLTDPQYVHRAFWNTVDHPIAGPHAHAGYPLRMSGTPPVARRAPLLGEHDAAIHGELS